MGVAPLTDKRGSGNVTQNHSSTRPISLTQPRWITETIGPLSLLDSSSLNLLNVGGVIIAWLLRSLNLALFFGFSH